VLAPESDLIPFRPFDSPGFMSTSSTVLQKNLLKDFKKFLTNEQKVVF
jgi:hypothetical protein